MPNKLRLLQQTQGRGNGDGEGISDSVIFRTSTSVTDEAVRAPLPTKFERIVDRTAQFEHLLQRKAKQTPIYEAFRNHTYSRSAQNCHPSNTCTVELN